MQQSKSLMFHIFHASFICLMRYTHTSIYYIVIWSQFRFYFHLMLDFLVYFECDVLFVCSVLFNWWRFSYAFRLYKISRCFCYTSDTLQWTAVCLKKGLRLLSFSFSWWFFFFSSTSTCVFILILCVTLIRFSRVKSTTHKT